MINNEIDQLLYSEMFKKYGEATNYPEQHLVYKHIFLVNDE